MQELEEVHDGMRNNQFDGQLGKDLDVTKARGAAYTGHSQFARKYQALMNNKEVLTQHT